VNQPTLNPTQTRLIYKLNESDWVQPTSEKTNFFSNFICNKPDWLTN